MKITAAGLILIPLSFVLFAQGSRRLFWATVSSAPFFAVRLISIPLFSSLGTPFMWFGALFLLRKLLDAALRGRAQLALPKEAVWLAAFLALSALSLFMPAMLRDSVSVVSLETTFKEYAWEPLRFQRNNLTQLAYPFFMSALFLALYSEMRKVEQVRRVVRTLIVGGLVLLGSGFFYQATTAVGALGLRDAVFQLVFGEPAPELDFAFWLFPRMYSLAGEPGYTSAFLTMILGPVVLGTFATAGASGGDRVRGRGLLIGLVLTGLVLTGGTTGILGLAAFFLAFWPIAWLAKRWRRQSGGQVFRSAWIRTTVLLVAVGLVFAVGVGVVAKVSFTQWMFQTHIGKLMASEDVAGSGFFRLQTTLAGFALFLESPLLGVGYGSHRTTTLLASLLSNVGILATGAFILFNLGLILGCLRVVKRTASVETATLAAGLTASMTAFIGTALVAKGMETLLFGFYWVVLAAMAAMIRLQRDRPPTAPHSQATRTTEA
ncbi:MAG: hypothetical protein JSU87_16195 [Gemmatimonadota bacterium]|nr:MAG: hypothetical protein JSU87_16195 [Gemmatimonadota bacterium]